MRRDSKNNTCGSVETAGKRELNTLYDYEMLLREIRLAHVEKDKAKLDELFTELCEATIKAEEGYKIQQTSFRTLVYGQYSKIASHITITCDAFEDVLQSVLTGIYDGSVFFRRLKRCTGDKRVEELEKILNGDCWRQINDFICNRTGTLVGAGIRDDFGIPDETFKVERDGKVYRNHVTMVSMQNELDNSGCDAAKDDAVDVEVKYLLKSKLHSYPISNLIDDKEKSPMEEIAVRLAEAFYETIIKYQYDEQDRADLLLYAQQVQNPIAPELRTGKLLTFASLPVAERFFHDTLRKCKFLGKALSMLSDDDLLKFKDELNIILAGTDDFQTKKNLVTACLSYIKDKQEEVA